MCSSLLPLYNDSFISSCWSRSIINAKVVTVHLVCWSLDTEIQGAQAVALACGLMGPFGNHDFQPWKAQNSMDRKHKDSQCVIGSDGKWVTPGYSLWFPDPQFFLFWTQSHIEVSDSLHKLHPKGPLLPIFAKSTSNAASVGHSKKFPQGSNWWIISRAVLPPYTFRYIRGTLICHPPSPTVMMIIIFGFTILPRVCGEGIYNQSRSWLGKPEALAQGSGYLGGWPQHLGSPDSLKLSNLQSWLISPY